MSDVFYRAVRCLGRAAFWVSSSPVVIGIENIPARGRFILAVTHQSPYDVALLIRHSPRFLDFVSIVEVFRNPIVAWLYGSLNAFPLDRSGPDPKTVRIILGRLERGRAIAMFPEGGMRIGPKSVVTSRQIRRGIGRISRLSRAQIVPCVLIGSEAYTRISSWLPLRRTRYGLIVGAPLSSDLAPSLLEARLVDSFVALHLELSDVMALESGLAQR